MAEFMPGIWELVFAVPVAFATAVAILFHREDLLAEEDDDGNLII